MRATRVTAPGAQRITINGIMAVPDNFGRLRLLILNEQPDGSPDGSWGRLRGSIPQLHAIDRLPYEEAHTSPDGVRGTAWIVLPTHRRAHWLGVATALRGQWVTAEVTVRPFIIRGAALEAERGISLDLSMVQPARPHVGRN